MAVPLPAAPKCIKLYCTGSNGPSGWGNVFYLQYSLANPSSVDLRSIATAFQAAWAANIASMLVPTVHFQAIRSTDLDKIDGQVDLYSFDTPGSSAGASMAANVALCVSRKIARRYKGGHPRFYLPGVADSNRLDQTHWSGSYLTASASKVTAFLNAVNAITTSATGGCKMVNVSYWYTDPPKTPPKLRVTPVIDPITGLSIDARIDSMRSRLG